YLEISRGGGGRVEPSSLVRRLRRAWPRGDFPARAAYEHALSVAGGLRRGYPAAGGAARALTLVRVPRSRALGRDRVRRGPSPLQSPQEFGYYARANTISWGSWRAALLLRRSGGGGRGTARMGLAGLAGVVRSAR